MRRTGDGGAVSSQLDEEKAQQRNVIIAASGFSGLNPWKEIGHERGGSVRRTDSYLRESMGSSV